MCFRPPDVKKPIRCPNCNLPNPPSQKVCKKCGTELPEPEKPTVSCPRCKARNSIDAEVCSSCGLTVEQATAMNNPIKCQCGTLNPPMSTTCRKCGAELPLPF